MKIQVRMFPTKSMAVLSDELRLEGPYRCEPCRDKGTCCGLCLLIRPREPFSCDVIMRRELEWLRGTASEEAFFMTIISLLCATVSVNFMITI